MAAPADSVILLHGLVRTEKSMGRLRRALERQGYHVINVGYDSRKSNIATLAEASIAPALEACAEGGRVHFVTHSMGGILLRQFLRQHTIQNMGRVVMLGPPNKGSEIVDRLREVPGFHLLHGDAGLELGTGPDSLPKNLGPANFDVGVIAGTRSVNLLLSTLIHGPDDGKVSVENTRLEGMNDHIQMQVTHTFMMRNNAVIKQVIHYLENGKFKRVD